MKKLFLTLLLAISSLTFTYGQCIEKCINSSATATVDFDATWTYNWTITPALAFTGQGTNQIDIANVGGVTGQYVIECTITTANCDTLVTNCIDVIDANPTLVLPLVCVTNGSVPVAGGSPAGGTYDINGTPILNITSAMIGQTINYTATSGGCSGTVSEVVVGAPMPNTTITIN